MNSDTFIFLLIGIAKYLENKTKYPYPSELQYSMNLFAYHLEEKCPRTISGFIQLCRTSTIDWYPIQLPHNFDSHTPLIFEDELSEQAYEFLDQFIDNTQLPKGANLGDLQISLDNLLIFQLLTKLDEASKQDPIRAQEEYVKARVYLISNPFTTTTKIQNTFELGRYVTPEEIVKFYTENTNHLFHTPGRNELTNISYATCERCGPIYSRNGHPQSAKLTLCNLVCPPRRWLVRARCSR